MSPVFVLAIDHRDSLRRWHRQLFGERADERELLREIKRLVLDGLLAALGRGLPSREAALLVDEEYGQPVIAAAKREGVAVIVPAERSGQPEFFFEHDGDFARHIDQTGPDIVKALVRYNPGGDRDRNARSRDRLARLQRSLTERDLPLMLELLVPPEPNQLAAVGGRGRYDADLRPELTLQAVTELSGAGLLPCYWKIEGQPTVEDNRRIARHALVTNRTCCLVLGRGEDRMAVERWISLAGRADGFGGFAVGRTIWAGPVAGWRGAEMARAAAARAIADAYLHFINVYREAERARAAAPAT